MTALPAPLRAAGAALAAVAVAPLLLPQAASAHGVVSAGALAGFAHPLLGGDHLLLLFGVGAAAALLARQLLLWALAGALLGGVLAGSGGTLPLLETLAALALLALGGWILLAPTRRTPAGLPQAFRSASGWLVAATVLVHAQLHGVEAPQDAAAAGWWAAALLSSLLLAGSSYALVRAVPARPARWAAGGLLLLGGLLAL